MQFLTPRFFDVLVLTCVVVGLFFAARRIRQDFKRGPRWPEGSATTPPPEQLADLPAGANDGKGDA